MKPTHVLYPTLAILAASSLAFAQSNPPRNHPPPTSNPQQAETETQKRAADTANAPKTDAGIKADISDRIFWSGFADYEFIHVDVKDGIAHLSGQVGSPYEKDYMIEQARRAGAIQVEDHLTATHNEPQ